METWSSITDLNWFSSANDRLQDLAPVGDGGINCSGYAVEPDVKQRTRLGSE
jgi:hypothetical protein